MAFFQACANGDCDKIKQLLTVVNVNGRDQNNRTGLHIASELGHLDVIRILLKYGANTLVYDDSKNTPIMLAYKARHVHVLRALASK